MMLEIQKNIPMPFPRGRKYPFAEMEIGDSFFTASRNVSARASRYGQLHHKKFVTRKVFGGGGIRVWRTE